MQNEILDKNKDFIEKKSGSAKFTFALVYKQDTFGIWSDYKNGKIFVSLDYDKSSPHVFAMTLADHSPNTLMFNAMRRYSFWKTFLENYKLGNVYFENQKVKHSMYELIKQFYSRN